MKLTKSSSLTVLSVISVSGLLTGCGASQAASTHHHVVHQASSTRTQSSSAQTAPSSASSSAIPTSDPFGSAAWSSALQHQLAQQLHDRIGPLDIVPVSSQWGFPAHSVLVFEPLAVHQQFYYAVVQKNHAVHWQHFSNQVTTIPSAVASKVPPPLFWAMHYAMLMQQGVTETPTLGNTIPWNTITGNVGNPVAIVAYYSPAAYGLPASLSITTYVPIHWKNLQDAGFDKVSLPNGHFVGFAVSAPVNSSSWQIQQSFYAVAPQNLSQDLPQTAAQGDFLLPHSR